MQNIYRGRMVLLILLAIFFVIFAVGTFIYEFPTIAAGFAIIGAMLLYRWEHL